MVTSVVAWHCGRCGDEVDPQYEPMSAVLCRECNRIVCRGCLVIEPTRESDYAVCRSCAGSAHGSESDKAMGLEQKVKDHLTDTQAKAVFYVVYAAVLLICPLAFFALARLVMDVTWVDKYNIYVTGLGWGLGIGLAEIIAKRVSMRG